MEIPTKETEVDVIKEMVRSAAEFDMTTFNDLKDLNEKIEDPTLRSDLKDLGLMLQELIDMAKL